MNRKARAIVVSTVCQTSRQFFELGQSLRRWERVSRPLLLDQVFSDDCTASPLLLPHQAWDPDLRLKRFLQLCIADQGLSEWSKSRVQFSAVLPPLLPLCFLFITHKLIFAARRQLHVAHYHIAVILKSMLTNIQIYFKNMLSRAEFTFATQLIMVKQRISGAIISYEI